MDILNILDNAELERRLTALCTGNFVVKGISKSIEGNSKAKIDNWPNASRKDLLKRLMISENKEYPGIYHNTTFVPSLLSRIQGLKLLNPEKKLAYFLDTGKLEKFLLTIDGIDKIEAMLRSPNSAHYKVEVSSEYSEGIWFSEKIEAEITKKLTVDGCFDACDASHVFSWLYKKGHILAGIYMIDTSW
jgi:hypothetical protein